MDANPVALQEALQKNPFPGTNISPDVKATPEIGTKVAKAIYSRNAYLNYSNNRIDNIVENRKYATNNQDPNQYKHLIDAAYNTQQEKKTLYQNSLVNISWRIWSPAKKFVNSVVGMFIDSKYSLQFNSIDKNSKQEKERKKNELIAGIVAADQLKAIADVIGGPQLSGEEQMLTSYEDVEMYMDTTYRQVKEMGMEMLVSHILKGQKYYQNIEPRLLHDLVENNKAVVMAKFDHKKSITIKYVDILGYLAPWSDHPTNDFSEYDGYVNFFSILELRDMLCDDYEGDVDKLLWQVASKAAGKYGNPNWGNYLYQSGQADAPWNDFRVEAMIFQWNTIDKHIFRYKERDGKLFVDMRKEIPKERVSEYNQKEIACAYEGIYITCIDEVLNWRKQENMVRPMTEKGVSSSLTKRFLYVEPNKRDGVSSSIIDDIKPCLNEIQVSILKIRQLIAESGPPGMAVDWDALSELLIDGSNIPQKELIGVMRTKGILFYSGRTEDGGQNRIPIHEIKSDFSVPMNAHLSYISSQIQMIREATGINDALDGSARGQDSLVGVQRQKAIAGHKLLRELFNAYSLQLFQELGNTLRDMIQMQIRHGWCEKEYRNVIGDACYDVLKMEPDMPFPLFGCHVEALPNEDQLNQIQAQLEIGLRAGTVAPQDVVDITSIGNPKKIMQTLKFRERKAREMKQQEMQMATQFETEKIQAASAARVEAETAIANAKADAKIREIQAMYQFRLTEVVEEKTLDGANRIREVHAIADRDDDQILLAASLGNPSGTGSRPAAPVKPTPSAKSTLQSTATP